jgi:Uncharacterized conserved protein containing a coiled-coil domain
MSSYEEIKELVKKALVEVLIEDPNILLEVLIKRPDVIQNALVKVAPWASVLSSIEDIKESMATKKDLEAMATKKDLEALKNTLESIKESMATKKDLEAMATKKDLEDFERRIQVRLDALGARWGLVNEDAFREGIRTLLKEAGYVIERWVWDDKEGSVYGHPSIVDLDVVIKDKILIIIEITSSMKRGEHIFLKKKVELYERVTGRKPSKIIIVTPYIADKNPDEVILRAKENGIDIIVPEKMINI